MVTDEIVISGKVTYNDLKLFKRSRTLIDWKVIDNVQDDEYGVAYISDLSDSAGIDEFVSFSGSLTGNISPN